MAQTPGGQTLLALEGVGYYQEKGKPMQILRKGDVARCPPDVEHWHGASHENWFVQLAITPEHQKGRVIWHHEVSEEEYQKRTKYSNGSIGIEKSTRYH